MLYGKLVRISGILNALQRLIDLEGLRNLDDALKSVGAIAISVDSTGLVVAQAAENRKTSAVIGC